MEESDRALEEVSDTKKDRTNQQVLNTDIIDNIKTLFQLAPNDMEGLIQVFLYGAKYR